MTKRKVKVFMYGCLYVLPLLFVPLFIWGNATKGVMLDLNDILSNVSNSFKIDLIYGWLINPIKLLVPMVESSSFAVYMVSYFSYVVLLTFIDILVDAFLWIPNAVHNAIERGNF